MFLEFACDKIAYFRTLKLLTKQEIIHSMERVTYEKDHLLCKKDDIATKMFIIQDGIVEVACKYAPKIEEQFVIERLGRGSIIGQYSVLSQEHKTKFAVMSRTYVRILTLSECFFRHYTNEIPGLEYCLFEVQHHEHKFGIPDCDIKVYDKNPVRYATRVKRAFKRHRILEEHKNELLLGKIKQKNTE